MPRLIVVDEDHPGIETLVEALREHQRNAEVIRPGTFRASLDALRGPRIDCVAIDVGTLKQCTFETVLQVAAWQPEARIMLFDPSIGVGVATTDSGALHWAGTDNTVEELAEAMGKLLDAGTSTNPIRGAGHLAFLDALTVAARSGWTGHIYARCDRADAHITMRDGHVMSAQNGDEVGLDALAALGAQTSGTLFADARAPIDGALEPLMDDIAALLSEVRNRAHARLMAQPKIDIDAEDMEILAPDEPQRDEVETGFELFSADELEEFAMDDAMAIVLPPRRAAESTLETAVPGNIPDHVSNPDIRLPEAHVTMERVAAPAFPVDGGTNNDHASETATGETQEGPDANDTERAEEHRAMEDHIGEEPIGEKHSEPMSASARTAGRERSTHPARPAPSLDASPPARARGAHTGNEPTSHDETVGADSDAEYAEAGDESSGHETSSDEQTTAAPRATRRRSTSSRDALPTIAAPSVSDKETRVDAEHFPAQSGALSELIRRTCESVIRNLPASLAFRIVDTASDHVLGEALATDEYERMRGWLDEAVHLASVLRFADEGERIRDLVLSGEDLRVVAVGSLDHPLMGFSLERSVSGPGVTRAEVRPALDRIYRTLSARDEANE